MKLRTAEIRELSVLQALIRNQAECIQGEVRILEKEIPTDYGPVMLGMDGEGRPVIIVASLGQEDGVLSRLIGIYRWTHQSMPLLIRFCAKGWLDGSKVPRVIAIISGYSRSVQEGIGLLAFSVEAYIWRGLEINGELNVLLEPIEDLGVKRPEPWSSEEPLGLLETSRLSEAELKFFERGFSPSPSQ